MTTRFRAVMVLAPAVTCPGWVAAADLAVVSVEPAAHSLTAPVHAAIVVHFDKPVKPESIVPLGSFWAFGRWSGTVSGTFSFSDGGLTVTLTPDQPFSAGETVMVILSHDIEATDGTTLRGAGYSFRFWTRTNRSSMNFVQVGELSVRGDGPHTQAYGGIASDLNGDRFLDVTIVNEITADLRVFLNKADNSGLLEDFIEPPFAVGNRASPSEPSDFNRDGNVDICVANIDDNSVSILLGNGDGTFAPQQVVTVGAAPRGIAVLDVDGDGDIDIVNTNFRDDNMSLLFNDGSGGFGPPVDFEGGVSGEWALAAADMNDDGILDLVVGSRSGAASSQRIAVTTGNGDGTFSMASLEESGGAVWMLVLGDVDGNGTEDVAAVNSFADRGSILLGDGAGNLTLSPIIYATRDFPLATDLGDLDGDGDLDWVTSSFVGFAPGEWALFTNRGNGTFTLSERFAAPQAGSCALMFDSDNDGDLDLALIDELADVVLLMQNSGFNPIPALSAWGFVCMALLLATAGAVVLRRRRPTGQAAR